MNVKEALDILNVESGCAYNDLSNGKGNKKTIDFVKAVEVMNDLVKCLGLYDGNKNFWAFLLINPMGGSEKNEKILPEE